MDQKTITNFGSQSEGFINQSQHHLESNWKPVRNSLMGREWLYFPTGRQVYDLLVDMEQPSNLFVCEQNQYHDLI